MPLGIRKWSDIHEDLLLRIAKNILTIQDFIVFGAVCRQWRLVTIDKRQFPLFSKPLLPWLMHCGNKEDNNYRAFFSPLENKVCANIKLPASQGCQCWGSPFGWLVTHRLQQKDLQIHLLNPFSQTLIQLPLKVNFNKRRRKRRRNYKNPLQRMHKAWIVLIEEFDNESDLRYAVYAVVGDDKDLVFATDRVDSWVTVHGALSTHDIIESNGAFYRVDEFGFAGVLYVYEDVPLAEHRTMFRNFVAGKLYLVELDGEVHMAARRWSKTTFKTTSIQVYRFNGETGNWEELETLGDNVVFIGRNMSFALKASEYPGCIPDCVYFSSDTTDNDRSSKKSENDIGIFSMETRSIKHFYDCGGLGSTWCWIMPRIK